MPTDSPVEPVVMRPFEKALSGAFVHNCLLHRREADPSPWSFRQDSETIHAALNGYAIVPLDWYLRQIGTPEEQIAERMAEVARADHDLFA